MNFTTNIEEWAMTAIQFDKQNLLGQARQYSSKILSSAKENPPLLIDIQNNAIVGKSFLLMFEQNVSNNEEDLQLISELSYFFISRAIADNFIKAQFILDRLILLFNSEDFLKETIKKAFNIKVDILSPLQSPQAVNHKVSDYLDIMRISDLEDKNALYSHIDFLANKREEYNDLLSRGYFGDDKKKEDVMQEGKRTHKIVFDFIESKLKS